MDAVEDLASEIGRREAVVSDMDIIESASSDMRGWYRGRALALVRPRSTEEVQRAVRACARMKLPIVPQGGNTSLVGGSVPDDRGNSVIMSLAGLEHIRVIDVEGWAITAEAGCTLASLQRAATQNDRQFGLDLGARDTARLGGLIATNAGGMGTIRYGSMREQVLGVEVVLSDGSVWNGLRALRKDNTGYDLKHLFVGSEGTLGIITAATLRLHPPERFSSTVLFALRDFHAINSSADALIGAGRLSALELMPGWGTKLACSAVIGCPMPITSERDWLLLARFAGPTSVEAHAAEAATALLESGEAIDAVMAQSGAQEAQLWAIRDAFSEVHRFLGHSFRFDLSVPLGRIPSLITRLAGSLSAVAPGARLFAFGHMGDGNLHFSVCEPSDHDNFNFRVHGEKIKRAVNEVCWSLGGSISAEHGIGQLHRAELAQQKSSEELDLQLRIKCALDPSLLFNPGKLFHE